MEGTRGLETIVSINADGASWVVNHMTLERLVWITSFWKIVDTFVCLFQRNMVTVQIQSGLYWGSRGQSRLARRYRRIEIYNGRREWTFPAVSLFPLLAVSHFLKSMLRKNFNFSLDGNEYITLRYAFKLPKKQLLVGCQVTPKEGVSIGSN